MKDIRFENLFLFPNPSTFSKTDDNRDLFHELRNEIMEYVEGRGINLDDSWDVIEVPDMPTFNRIVKDYGILWAYIIALSARPYQTLQLLKIFETETKINDIKMFDSCRDDYYSGYAHGYSARTKDEIKTRLNRIFNEVGK